jgi:transposase
MDQTTPLRWVGIDVSKATLDVAILPDEDIFRVRNDAGGWRQLVARITSSRVQGIVLEATGSYHRGITLALAAAGLASAVINPQRTHAFIVSEGMRGKTDRGDARLLARFGQQKQPAPAPVDTETARILKDLVGCRDDLTKSLVMEKNCLAVASEPVRDVHETTIAFLTEQIAGVDQRIADLIAADVELAARNQILRSVPGIGPVLSAVLLARLAELGQRDPKTLASLAGVAPHPQDSGTRRSARTIGGGRPPVCRALYQMAQTALRCAPVITAHYRQLRRRMPHEPAVVACARRMLGILNAMLRDGLTWQQTRVGQGHFLPETA